MVDWSLAHVNDRNGLIIMCAIFCVSSITVTALRFYARRFKKLRFQADDWTILAALVCSSIVWCTAYNLGWALLVVM